jgi:ABC-type transport system involved in Fe-S cluster assembly fused permease/ATPase subunit
VLLRGRTSLIIVLRGGRIVEQGDHAFLLSNGGLYAELNASGTASFDDAA